MSFVNLGFAVTDMTLSEAIDKFLTYLEGAGRTAETIVSYRRRFVRFLAHFGPGRELASIAPEELDSFAASLRTVATVYDNHSHRKPVHRKLSEPTVYDYLQAPKTFLRFCHRRGYTATDLGQHLELPQLDHGRHDNVMSRQDLYRLLDAAYARALAGRPRDLAMLMFMVDTGCRRGELVNLRINDLRLAALEADVYGKTGRRQVDYTLVTAQALEVWLSIRPAAGHPYVFTGDMRPTSRNRGGQLKPDAVNKIFARLAQQAGVRGPGNPHAVRHLVGQTWADNVNLELVRQKLGHRNITTTAMIYAHQDLSRVKAATQLYSPLVGYRRELGGDNLAVELWSEPAAFEQEDEQHD
ncbi:MAG: tyrosine-type recombinase/integrase [Chloroflexi bacterium]|nr:tyrosine-type recombinase/integrase [Chloroflexota bacterium]